MLFAKFYTKQFDTTPVIVEECIYGGTLKDDISTGASFEFDLPIVSGIRQFMKVEIVEAKGWVDTLIFRGYVHDPEYSESRISILCKDEKQLLKAKACTTDRSFSGATPSSAIQTILSDWNSAYGEDFSGFVATSVKTITKDAQKGDDIFTWIDTVCEIAWFSWTVRDQSIYVAESIWEDRSVATSENFAELVYNGQNHIEDNVSAPKLKSYSTLANVVIGSANNTKVIVSDSTSVSTYGAFAVYKSFDSGDATTQANAWLAESKELQQVFSMVVRPDSVDANVWDKVRLRIEKTNEYLNYEGAVSIVSKTVKFENAGKKVTIEVGDVNVKSIDFWKRFALVESNIKKLSL